MALVASRPGQPSCPSHPSADDAPPSSPGQLAVHYAPRTPTLRVEHPADLVDYPWPDAAALLSVGPHDLPPLPPLAARIELTDPIHAARSLYARLHECDALAVDQIIILMPPDRPEWHALRDRLLRASRPVDPR